MTKQYFITKFKDNWGLPDGYIPVEYLESTRTQWIDTGIVPAQTLDFEVKFNFDGASTGNVFGSRVGSGVQEYQLSLHASGMVGVGRRTGGLGFYANNEYVISYDGQNTVTINGVNKTIITSTPTDKWNIVLFGITNSGTVAQLSSGKIYYCRFGDSRYFIPCLDSSGIPCMVDLVTQQAFYNKGTGQFKYGRILSKYYIPLKREEV